MSLLDKLQLILESVREYSNVKQERDTLKSEKQQAEPLLHEIMDALGIAAGE